MKDDDIQNLLGGFATDTLTDRERERLFTAALTNQELFDALADEQALRELLSDPVSRGQLLQALEPRNRGVLSWIRRPQFQVAAIAAVMALVAVVAIRQSHPPPIQLAVAQPRAEKMKVAVLDFNSSPAVAKESDVGKRASDLLGKKLVSGGYTVIDRKQVDKAMHAQNLEARRLNPSAAASLGRSLGADAVIVGSVKTAERPALQAPAAEFATKKQEAPEVQVSAQAINTQTSANFAEAASQRQASQTVLVDAVNQVASSLVQQIQQNAGVKTVGLVTDVSDGNVTMDAGAKTGIKVGDKFEVRRDGKPIGRLVIQSVKDATSTGAFQGDGPARIGDSIASSR